MTPDAGASLAQPMGCRPGHSARSMSSAAAGEPGWDLAGIADAAREGDQDAFAELYRRLAPGIFDHILVLVRDRGSAEDILQQTFLDAWRGLATLREPDRVRGWLYGIARHLAQDHLRSRPVLAAPLEDAPELESPEPGPEALAISGDAEQLVWDAAASLEPQHREALSLSLRQALTYREIGDALGLKPARASDLLVRAREALGRAVQLLLVARSSASCASLKVLAPQGATSLTVEQRRAVDHHLRACPACRSLASQLTRPEELFGTIVLAALPAGAQHPPALPPATAGPAKLAAAHVGAGHPRRLPRRTRLGDRYRRMTVGIGLALLVGIGAAVIPLPRSPGPTAPSETSTPGSLWTQSLQDLSTLTSYRIAFSTSVPVLYLAAFDISVGPTGSWSGTVTDSTAPSPPLTMADEGSALYVQGGPGLVALASWFSLTTAQAEALGGRWLSCDSIVGEDEANILADDIALYTTPSALALQLPLPLVTPSESPTTADGQAVIRLSAAGTQVEVTRGAHPYPLSISDGPEHFTLGAFNQPVTPPDVSGAVTWSQLTGGSPPP